MPRLPRSRVGRFGLFDPEKVFCTDHKADADIFALRGNDHELGCLVDVRPDPYLRQVLRMAARGELAACFAGTLESRSNRPQDGAHEGTAQSNVASEHPEAAQRPAAGP